MHCIPGDGDTIEDGDRSGGELTIPATKIYVKLKFSHFELNWVILILKAKQKIS